MAGKIAYNISTHTSLAGRDQEEAEMMSRIFISTHTSLAGRDEIVDSLGIDTADFYSHVPRGT